MKPAPTDEQRAAAAEKRAKFRALAAELARKTPEELSAMLGDWPTTIEGHRISMHNAVLAACQFPAVTVIGGFWQWRKAGRKVRKGEHGFMIWAPKTPSKDGDEDTTPEDVGLAGRVSEKWRFTPVTVFDISQTEAA